jgi:hypothetical protein
VKVSDLTISALNPFVTGDGGQTPYMSGPELIKFFNTFGFSDEYGRGGLPDSLSRNEYSYKRLQDLNGKYEFRTLVEALVDSRKVIDSNKMAVLVADFIKHDGYLLQKNELDIYKVLSSNEEDPILIEAHFNEIKNTILNSIKGARFTIWIAVAWFTDKDIGNELRLKHLAGINVRIVVNDDENTRKFGLPFDTKGIEYNKVSPGSPWGKKIMHNKFCIIDLLKVIHGSYNWTSNAQYNNESITITESRELAEDFSNQFIELIGQGIT